MNKVYKVLFNKSIGKCVVVSENSKSAKKSSKTIQSIVLAVAAFGGTSISVAATLQLGGGTATGLDAIAIGDRSNASGILSIALGADSVAQEVNAGAIGSGAKALGDDSFAVGTRAQALADYSTALGNQSAAKNKYDLAAGYNAIASGGQSTAVGFAARSTGTASNAIGGSSLAEGEYSTAVGQETHAKADFTLAAGYKANASGEQSTAVGFGSQSTGYGSNAIGSSSSAKGLHSTAIGSSSLAEGDYSIALGQEAKTGAGKNFTTALGYKANASGWSSFAQGAYAEASGGGSIAIGDSSKATTNDTIAIGVKSEANLDNSVALGIRSKTSTNAVTVTSATVGGITYGGFTGAVSSPGSQISVGDTGNERQIKHVAAGAISQTSTDAINGSQLFSTQKALGNLASSTSSALGGGSKVNPDGSLSLPTYVITNNPKTPGTKVTVHTVGDALSALDSAVNVPLVFKGNTGNDISKKLGDTLSIKGGLANADAATATNLRVDEENGELKIKLARNLTDLNSVTTNNLTATGDTQLGDSFTVNKGGSYYTGPITEGNHITNKTYVDQQTAAAKTEVAAGTNVKDVVKTQGTNGQDIYTVNAKGTTASAGSSAVTVTAGTPDANNVTDYAVDLSQDTKDSLVKADTALQSIETQIDGVTVKTVNKDDNKVNFVTGDNVELTANADGSITVGTAADVTFNSVTTNNLTATGDTQLGDSFTVNKGGSYYTGPITEGDHITNKTYVDQQTAAAKTEVAAGTNVKDVVKTQGTNGQDIYTVNAKGTTASAGSSAVTVTAGTPDANNVTDYAVDLSQDTKDSLVKADTALQSIETQIDGVTVKTVNKDDNKVNFVTGDNVELTANADGSITVGTAADVTFNSVTTNNLTATGDTHLGDSFTVNKGGSYYTGPITEGDHITNKTYVDQQTAAAKTEVAAGTNVKDVVKTQGTNGQDIYTVNAKGTTASAGSSAVTVTAGTPDANNVTDYAVDLSQDTKDSLVKADTALQSIETQIDGVTVKTVNKDDNKVNFVTGDNVELTANADGSITVGTAADVTFNSVTTNNLTATGETKLGDSFIVNNTGATYTGPITEGNHIVNKDYVDNSVNVLADTPLNFAGNTGDAIAKKLGETLTISGELAEGEDATGANLRVDSANGILNLMMAKDLTDLNSIVINGGPTINNNGINMNGGTITNLAAGVADSDAVNMSQLKEVSNVANAGWNIATDSGTTSNVKPGDTVNMKGDGSIVVSNTGNDVTVGLADVVTVGQGDTAVTIDGTKGTIQAGTEVTIDGNTGVIQAGDVTINGDKGTVNGLSNTTWDANNIVKGQAATEDQLKVVADNVTTAVGAAKTEVEAGKNVTVSSQLGDNNQTIYTVATKDEVDFNKVTVGGLTIDKGNVDANSNTIISGVGAGEISSTSTDAVNGSQLYATNQQVAQNTTNIAKNTTDITNINTTLDKGLNFSADSGSTVNRKLGDTVAITGDGNITTTTTANGVQVKLSDSIDVKNVNVSQNFTVAEGANVNMGGNVIQNVGAGVADTDAVNVGQLKNVANHISNVEDKLSGGIAASAALAVVTPVEPGTYHLSGGTAYYNGGYGVGFNLLKRSDNGRTTMHAGVAWGSGGGGALVRIGAGFSFGGN